jgi:glycopeptide antibiotics resistance protein
MKDILKMARIQIGVIVLFALFKFIRPSVLDSDAPQWIKIMLLSLPNFFEAIIGILTVTGIGLYLNDKLLNPSNQLKTKMIYIFSTILAAIYVITQEFKIHNLGGENVYDINDVIFSIVGLVIGYLIIRLIKPVVNQTASP